MMNVSEQPWRVQEGWSEVVGRVYQVFSPDGLVGKFLERKDADKCVLAFNAEEVMKRRGWWASKFVPFEGDACWCVDPMSLHMAGSFAKATTSALLKELANQFVKGYTDPFTPLVEADKWYRENIEATAAPAHTSPPSLPSPSKDDPMNAYKIVVLMGDKAVAEFKFKTDGDIQEFCHVLNLGKWPHGWHLNVIDDDLPDGRKVPTEEVTGPSLSSDRP